MLIVRIRSIVHRKDANYANIQHANRLGGGQLNAADIRGMQEPKFLSAAAATDKIDEDTDRELIQDTCTCTCDLQPAGGHGNAVAARECFAVKSIASPAVQGGPPDSMSMVLRCTSAFQVVTARQNRGRNEGGRPVNYRGINECGGRTNINRAAGFADNTIEAGRVPGALDRKTTITGPAIKQKLQSLREQFENVVPRVNLDTLKARSSTEPSDPKINVAEVSRRGDTTRRRSLYNAIYIHHTTSCQKGARDDKWARCNFYRKPQRKANPGLDWLLTASVDILGRFLRRMDREEGKRRPGKRFVAAGRGGKQKQCDPNKGN
ncbi:hypothetical protein C8R43DRAFT_956006 [Mycena crocata]|nr:hypothetical protein C8R43DRAFT_956006 [Mycena crocata]